jgi:hypothetical protein
MTPLANRWIASTYKFRIYEISLIKLADKMNRITSSTNPGKTVQSRQAKANENAYGKSRRKLSSIKRTHKLTQVPEIRTSDQDIKKGT